MPANSKNGPFDNLPKPADFLLNVPLYEVFRFDEDEGTPFFALEHFKESLDCHCPACGKHSVFTRPGEPKYADHHHLHNYIFSLWFVCSRDQNHKIMFIFRSNRGVLQKIGQYPSLADLATPDLQKYRPVLGEERFRELSRAIGLAAHGIGIGAFVYMRRIFEGLVENARASASADARLDQASFERSRMEEKIAILRDHLPDFLVENRALYAIMSVGVHTLSEQECLAAFPAVRVGIELILDDQLERARRAQKIKDASNSIAALKGSLGKPDAT